jgi:hypothetical protein
MKSFNLDMQNAEEEYRKLNDENWSEAYAVRISVMAHSVSWRHLPHRFSFFISPVKTSVLSSIGFLAYLFFQKSKISHSQEYEQIIVASLKIVLEKNFPSERLIS